jgi:peroxiredoxin family protein/TusA-related sulfurtransferase
LRLYCAVGFRSYLAQRALVQRGFADVATLSGGTTTFRFWHDLAEADNSSPAPMEPYAERESIRAPERPATGVRVDLDCAGLACPGPILKLSETMGTLKVGDEIQVNVSDPGFAQDAPAWARRNGHQLLALTPRGPGYEGLFRKGQAGQLSAAAPGGVPAGKLKTSFVVFSGDLDKLIAAFIIANGALAMGEDVSMFFTFWGLNSLRTKNPPRRDRKAMDRMFAAMMPSGADALSLSSMNMLGAGTAMINKVMKKNGVTPLPDMITTAQAGGARLIACTMTMDLLGIAETDLLEGVEFGGVATFLDEAADSRTTLFI